MGADRKGPLAAFIVVAVIAVILLVTSVRSQAAPGWIQGRLPASIVAAVPDAPAAGVWGAVGDGVGQAVEHGVVLVRRATEDPTTTTGTAAPTGEPVTTAAVITSSAPTTGTSGGPASGPAAKPHPRTPAHRRPAPVVAPATDQSPGHGRHLGRVHAHHGQGHGHQPHGHGHGLHLGWTRGS